jgi:hypothetical protein
MQKFLMGIVVLTCSFGVARAQTSITMWQADTQHTGQNLHESILTPGTVSSPGNFGLLFTQPTDGQIYGQPLIAAGVNINGTTHNVVYVATEHDSIYAFDADGNSGANASPLWQDSFIQSGVTEPVPQADVSSADISDELGITTTPVIDPSGSTIYIVSKIKRISDGTYHQYFHALDLATGAEKFNGPVEINPTFPGSSNFNNTEQTTPGVVPFNALREHLRSAMALYNGVVYLAYASHSDANPYHGEILGYDASTLQLVKSFISTPNNTQGGFWGAGASPAFDASGNMFIDVANGAYDQTSSPYTSGTDWGESMLKLSTVGTLTLAYSNTLNWFTPNIWQNLNNGDLDLGSSGLLLLPDQAGGSHTHLLVGGGKGGVLYVVDRDNLGGIDTPDNAVQEFTTPNNNYLFATPAYFNGNIYYSASGSPLEQRTVGYNATTGNYISPTSVKSAQIFNGKGSGCFISANGNAGGIVWILTGGGLQAYDATNVSSAPLISLNATTENNVACQNTKFSLPTVANGKAYFTAYQEGAAGTNRSTGYLFVSGIFPSAAGAPSAPSNAAAAPASSTGMTVTWTDNSNNESGFIVKRGTTAAGPFTATGTTIGANVTTYADTGLSPNTAYYYQVFAQNANGPSSASNVASGTTFPVYSANGLVAYWALDESSSSGTAADSSGNGHTGTVNGEAVFANALINDGIELHGTGNATSNISVPSTASMQFGVAQSFTLSAWIEPENIHGVEQAVLAKSADQGNAYGIWINANNQYVFRGPGGDVVGSAATTGVWAHVAVVQDGTAGTRKIYVNGVLQATGAAQAADGAGALWMGQQNVYSALDSFPGVIDEVRLYNRALAATEITTLMGPPILEALSTQKQGNAGTYGLVIAPTSVQVCEPREGSTVGAYNLVLNFSAPVSGMTASLGLPAGGSAVGRVASISYDASGKIVTIALTGVGNGQALDLHLGNILPGTGTADVPFNVLWGDVNSDNIVDYLDTAIVQNNTSPLVSASSYLYDLNCDGTVTSADTALATSAIGTALGAEVDTNLALYQPAADLNSLNPNFAPLAFDNQTNTRWESVHGVDPDWIEVDLGSVSAIHSIMLNWENAAGASYFLQSSTDNINWTNLLPEITGNASGGIRTYSGLTSSGRFVRMYGLTRTTVYGYSLWEFQVNGIPGSITANLAPSITGDLSTSGTQGQSLGYQITAANSPTSYAATNLPSGLGININTGLISGSPTTSGTQTAYITATNSHGTSASTPVIFTLAGSGNAPVITSATTAAGTVGTAFSYQIVVTNGPTSFGASGLPAGLSINSATGLISGIPSSAGSPLNVTLTATNATGTATGNVAITISPAAVSVPMITSATTATGTVGNAFTYQIGATNNPTSFNATGLPSGLSVNTTTGLISGTPTSAGGPTTVSLSAGNSGGTGTGTVAISISAAAAIPAITSPNFATGTVGAASTYQIAASGNPTAYNATGLPSGFSVNPTTGLISGTPTAPGLTSVTVSATNGTGTGSASVGFTINAAPTGDVLLSQGQPVAASSVTGNNVGSLAFDGNNGTRWESAYSDPQWIYVDLNAVDTIHSIMLHWEGAAGKNYQLQVSNDLVNWTPIVTVTNNTIAGVLNYTGLNATGRYVRMYGTSRLTQYGYSLWEFQVYGVPGVPIDTNVALNKPSSSTTYTGGNVAGYAFDGLGNTRWESAYSDPQSIQVDLGAIYNIDTILLDWENAAGQNYTLQVSNDNVTWTTVQTVTGNTASGSLAYPGLATSGRYVKMAGTTRDSVYGYSLWEFQVLGYSASGAAATITSPRTATATVGAAFSYQITATNNPTTFSASNLPAGLTLDPASGLISGSPTGSGSTTVNLTAGNGGDAATGTVLITVNPAGNVPVISSATSASGTVGVAFTYQITGTNNPTNFGATNLPAGLGINLASGLISGTPTASGTKSVGLSASNGIGTGMASVSVTIGPAGDANLALKMAATASSFQAGNLVANANDGSLNTRWAASSSTMPQSWTVDLGAVKTLSHIDIAWYSSATRYYQYHIDVSTDNSTFTTVIDKTANTTFGNTSDGFAGTARYVRVTVTKASAGWASVNEIGVYGH